MLKCHSVRIYGMRMLFWITGHIISAFSSAEFDPHFNENKVARISLNRNASIGASAILKMS